MKNLYPLLIPGFLLLFFSLQARAGDPTYYFPAACHQVSFDGVHKLILVEASIDGRQGWFLFDTGMKDLLLNTRHFETLPFEEVPDSVSLVDVWGESRLTHFVEVGAFQWGEIQRKDFLSLGTDLQTMEEVLERDILGLIGLEVVRRLELVVDYRKQLLTMRQPGSAGECGSCRQPADYELAFAYQNHLPALKTSVGNRSEMWLGLDTGSSLSMIDPKHRRKLRKKIHSVTRIRYGSVNGIYEIPLANIHDLDLGKGLNFSYWRFGFNRLEHFEKSGMYLDGLIGGDFFRLGVVSLNFAEQTIRIWLRETNFLRRYPNLHAKAKQNGEGPDADFQLACLGN